MTYEQALALVGAEPNSSLRGILESLPANEQLAQAARVVLRWRSRRSRH